MRIQFSECTMFPIAFRIKMTIASKSEQKIESIAGFKDSLYPIGRSGVMYFQSIYSPLDITRNEFLEFFDTLERVIRMSDGKYSIVFLSQFSADLDGGFVLWEIVDRTYVCEVSSSRKCLTDESRLLVSFSYFFPRDSLIERILEQIFFNVSVIKISNIGTEFRPILEKSFFFYEKSSFLKFLNLLENL